MERQLHRRRYGSVSTDQSGKLVLLRRGRIMSMQRLFNVAAVLYILIYAGEGVVRYGLYSIGHDDAILLRDLLIIVPLGLLFVAQALRGRVHPAFAVFAAIVAVHGAIAMFNLSTYVPAIYGAKLLINLLFGFLAARELLNPGPRTMTIFALIWLVSITGVVLDKFLYTFPWTGLETHIGGIRVDISRGWDIDDSFDKRVAGFTRSSISAAMLLPILATIMAPRIRNMILRFLVLTITVGAVFLTTQKGAVIAIAAVTVILCAPRWSWYGLLCFACVMFAVLDVALPVLSAGLLMPQSAGVFSFASFAMRITLTWPEAWQWIANHNVFPFGVGLGGIGGAQRFYAADFFNPSDNLFVYLYANFGVFGLAYLAWVTALGPRLPRIARPEALQALAVLAFILGYGAALSMLEDQMAALFVAAAAGMLWQLRQEVFVRNWSDSYQGSWLRRARPSMTPGFAPLQVPR
ncbi:MAG TPA: hypothetical protein VHX39_11190 [Acetobacteraceae bacterium]|nr:hypothetical protein [Acetobacteraceae bacterium]